MTCIGPPKCIRHSEFVPSDGWRMTGKAVGTDPPSGLDQLSMSCIDLFTKVEIEG